MSFESHQISTGSKRYERRALRVGDDIVGAVDGEM